MCVNRFDEDTKTSFLDLYSKIDADATLSSNEDDTDDTWPPDEDGAVDVEF